MPSTPFIVNGTISNSNGVNISNAKITFTISDSHYSISGTTGSYVFDLANINYTSGDTVTYSAIDEFNNETFNGSFVVTGSNKILNVTLSARISSIVPPGNRNFQLYNVGGKPVTSANPLPVTLQEFPEDFEISWTITRADDQPDSETVIKNGITKTRTFTYNSNGRLTNRSKWVKQ